MDKFTTALDRVDMSAIAEGCGITRQAVWKWKRSGFIPAERVLTVERITGIPRSELRPDLYPADDKPTVAPDLGNCQ